MTIETKMDPLAARFAEMEEAPHEEAVVGAAEQEAQPAEAPAEAADVAVKSHTASSDTAATRPMLDGVKGMARSEGDFTARYLRRGLDHGLEHKSFEGTSGVAGGYAIPQEIDAVIDRTLTDISPIRSIATVVKVGSADYRKLVTTGGTPSGWVSEDAARPETDTPDFEEIAPPMGELYANPAASQAMLDDAAFDVEAWLANEIATEFARAEGAAFVTGSGIDQPRGFLQEPTESAGDEVRGFGQLQYVTTGRDGGFAMANPEYALIDLVQALRAPYRQGAHFVMNSATLSAIRKFKTADGAFLWQPGLMAGQPDTLLGYAIHGPDARASIDTLSRTLRLYARGGPAGIYVSDQLGSETEIPEAQLGAAAGEAGGRRIAIDRSAVHAAPSEMVLRYYDSDRDYQAGSQRAWLDGPGRMSDRIDFPATLTALRAKAIVEARLARTAAERERARVTLPWTALTHRPGDTITLPQAAGAWRVTGLTLERMVVTLELARIAARGTEEADSATPGRTVSERDREHGPTRIEIIDVPGLGDDLHSMPRIFIAAAGSSPGWRSAGLALSLDGGQSFEPHGRTAPPAIMGQTIDALAPGQAQLFDRINSVEIKLLHDEMWLAGASDEGLISGANLALIGDELIQFGRAEALGDNRFRLSALLRGRRGTEWAMNGHRAGDRFVLIEESALKVIDLPVAAMDGSIEIIAAGIGDDPEPAGVSHRLIGRSVRPPTPVHLRAGRESDGAISISWVRRSRAGWSWPLSGEVPIGEEQEQWRVTIIPSIGRRRVITSATSLVRYGLAEQIADGARDSAEISVAIEQIGTIGESAPPAQQTFTV